MSRLNQLAKEKIAFLWSSLGNNLLDCLYFLVILLLPTQLGYHFFIKDSYVYGLRIDYLSPTLYLADLLIVALFVLSIIKRKTFSSFSKKALHFPTILVLSFFLLPVLWGIFFALRPLLVFYFIFKFLEFSFFGYYTYFYSKQGKNLSLILIAFSLGMFFESCLAVFQFLLQSSVNGLMYFFGERTFTKITPGIATTNIGGTLLLRPYGTLPHPNVLGGYLLLGIIFLWYQFQKCRDYFAKRALEFVVLFSSFALLLSLSRVVIIAFFISLFVFLVRKKNVFVRKNLFVFLIGFVFLLLLSEKLFLRFLSLSFSSESVTNRVALMQSSIGMIRDNFLLGVSPFHFLVKLPTYFVSQHNVFFIQPVHNIYLLVFSELGVIGFIGFLIILYILFRRILSLRSEDKAMAMNMFLIILCIGMVDHYFLTLQQGQLLFAFFVGTVFGLSSIEKKRKKRFHERSREKF